MTTGNDSIVSFGDAASWLRGARLLADAVRTRWILVTALILIFGTVGAVASVLLPRSYSASARLLVRKNYVMPALAHPRRAVPMGSEAPTQSAPEFVLSRQALDRIVEETGLVRRWDLERPALLRLKDRLLERLRGPIPEEERTEQLVDVLARRLSVSVQGEVVTVMATWPAPQTVVDLVDAGVRAFLEARRKVDVQAVAEIHGLLERSAEIERTRVERQLAAVTAQERAAAGRGARPAASRGARAADREAEPPALVSAIRDARRGIAAMERHHREQVIELEGRLAQSRAMYTERHPDVVAMQQALARLREEPGTLVAARATEARLVAGYLAAGGRPESLAVAEAGPRPADQAEGTEAAIPPGREEDDSATAYTRSLFKGSLDTYQDLLGRLADVRIELETAQAAFGYRYSVTVPPRRPRKANAPNVPLVVIGAVLAGTLAGVTGAGLAELRARALLSPSALARHLSAPGPAPERR